MGNDLSTAYKRHRAATAKLAELFRDADHFNVIHYSCETFYGENQGQSKRITSISVLNVGSQQQVAFSIHTSAEQLRNARGRQRLAPDAALTENYDVIEFELLRCFYEYVKAHPNARWLHWNMRDTNYGFAAIEGRFRALKGDPVSIPSSMMFNLADALVAIYGRNYVPHRRMYQLIDINDITDVDMLSGEEEAEAFEKGEYVRLHNSTLRKVQALYTIAQRAQDGQLKTNASWWNQHGSSVAGVIDAWTASWPVRAITLGLSAYSVIDIVRSLL